MADRPSGTVTFLFTDVEGSTATWDSRPDDMRLALALHDEMLRAAVDAHTGRVFATGGDGLAAVFNRADAAVAAAVAIQAALAEADWPAGLALRVRVGLHTGEAHERDGDYFGPAVNRAARVMDAANGSQILTSASTREVASLDAGVGFADLGEHELRDVIDPMRLYRVDSTRFASDPRPPRTGGARAGNVPTFSSQLIGREHDIAAISSALDKATVVTLVGVGGIGKTRLAVEVARQQQSQRRDGAWFAPLDTVDREDALLPALHGILGIDSSGEGDLASLVGGLHFRDALIVLDNCEHLLGAVASLATAIVASCPGVGILATSREPLGIECEHIRPIRSLSTDDDGAAMELFRLRADAAGAGVDDTHDRDAVARICRRLDGIPLAIELAAARARTLRPAQIADRLDDMFRLLTGGRRASTERHRTLRATLEWSYDMLSEPEQSLLDQLSIFAGSFALDAAEAVARTSGARDDVIELLDQLVTRSLLVPDDGFETRFRLLEPVRQLAAEKLAARGDTDSIRAAHTSWYLDLIDRLGSRWRNGDDQGTWPIAMRELPNLRAAFDDLVDSGRVDDAQRFAVASYGPIGCQFDPVPMYEWAPRAASLDGAHVGPFTASTYALAGWGAMPQGDLAGAGAWLQRGVAAIEAGSLDDGFVSAAAIHLVLSGGEPAVSDSFHERSLQDALKSGDPHRQVWVLTYAGRYEEAVDEARRLGNRTLIGLALSWAASLSTDRDDAREAFWQVAQQSHSYLMRNHAAMEIAFDQIRRGMPLEGLLLLRAPARDWLLRNDSRVWSVLHLMAIGFAEIGETETAARIAGAIADRPLPFLSATRLGRLRDALDSRLELHQRARLERTGHGLDAGEILAEVVERIEWLAERSSLGLAADEGRVTLTSRQLDVAELVARGLTNKQIAQRLGISRFTAETHVRNILERLGAATRSEIATWIARDMASGTHRST